ncbi:hypothetical protein K2173_022605 [Erythroxylum novogranatense]|uniref:Seipin-2-like n=1 Tax=Erythroxylum novogranatense TaxID=1862640 RepID=A0AAV8SUT8_9ROSI|nr:hypothetical protein K2173_022605 [Erythroxylum novogranatense]
MDESKLHENDQFTTGVINGSTHHDKECDGFDFKSLRLSYALKCFLLKLAINGADILFMDRKNSKMCYFSSDTGKAMSELDGCRRLSATWVNGWGCSSNNYLQGESSKNQFGGISELIISKYCNVLYFPLAELVSKFLFNFFACLTVSWIKLVGFQLKLLVTFLTFPIWSSYYSLMFLMYPLRTLKYIRAYFVMKLLKLWGVSARRVNEKLQESVGIVAARFGCAFLWSSYACFILVTLLISGFLLGTLLTSYIVEKPIHTHEILSFDYTKASPIAFVPMYPGNDGFTKPSTKDNIETSMDVGARVIPHNHKLRIAVSLVMPESEYNRKLGVFQVKVKFVSGTGKVTASSSYPCMLRFKSYTIRLVETIVRSVPLLAGFISESQILNVQMNDFTEGLEPTSFLRVIIEQRAEFNTGAGIPEIYAASLSLERTIFVWTSIIMFLTELMLVLVFCRPLLVPRRLQRTKSGRNDRFRNQISWYKST